MTLKKVFDAVRSERSVIHFQQLIPMPENIMNSTEEVEWQGMKVNQWEAWAAEHRGTFKNACDAQYFQSNAIDFDTPWSQPVPVFEALAKRFPQHVMVVTADYLLINGEVESDGRHPVHYVEGEGDAGERS